MTARPYSGWEGLPDGWIPADGLMDIHDILQEAPHSMQRRIAEVGIALTSLLLLKNRRYGNSVMDPIEVFVTGLTKRQRLAVRMDDKINRISKGLGSQADDGEHPGLDLAGYLILDIIAEWEERAKPLPSRLDEP